MTEPGDASVLQACIRYAYNGELDPSVLCDLPTLVRALILADYLMMSTCYNAVVTALKAAASATSLDVALTCWPLSSVHTCVRECIQSVLLHAFPSAQRVLSDEDARRRFLSLPIEVVRELLRHPDLQSDSEDTAMALVCTYAAHADDEAAVYLVLLPDVRLVQLGRIYFYDVLPRLRWPGVDLLSFSHLALLRHAAAVHIRSSRLATHAQNLFAPAAFQGTAWDCREPRKGCYVPNVGSHPPQPPNLTIDIPCRVMVSSISLIHARDDHNERGHNEGHELSTATTFAAGMHIQVSVVLKAVDEYVDHHHNVCLAMSVRFRLSLPPVFNDPSSSDCMQRPLLSPAGNQLAMLVGLDTRGDAPYFREYSRIGRDIYINNSPANNEIVVDTFDPNRIREQLIARATNDDHPKLRIHITLHPLA